LECEVVRGQKSGRWSWVNKGEGEDRGIGTVGRVEWDGIGRLGEHEGEQA